MKDNYTHIVYVLDRSGSMNFAADDVIGGFNEFLKNQKAEKGDATFSLVQFDHEYKYVYENQLLKNVQELNRESYQPRGQTALLDAIGRAAVDAGAFLSNLNESDRPSKVIFVIQTDGHENSSKQYTYQKISDMIKHQQEVYSWNFLYLGANQDAIKEGAKLSISQDYSLTYSNNSLGNQSLYASTSAVVSGLRNNIRSTFTAADRDQQAQTTH